MGQLCGKESSGFGAQKSPFNTPGRALASASPREGVSQVPEEVMNSTTSPIRSEVATGGAGGYGTVGTAGIGAVGNEDARRNAAAAAERRAKVSSPKGQLGKKLQAEKNKTVNDHLVGASSEEMRRREVDDAEETRNYN